MPSHHNETLYKFLISNDIVEFDGKQLSYKLELNFLNESLRRLSIGYD